MKITVTVVFSSSFLPKIRAILKETHLELYSMTEVRTRQHSCVFTHTHTHTHTHHIPPPPPPPHTHTQSFYKQKGPRVSTRLEEIPETFESCMDSLIERCHTYRTQAEEYRNDCIEGVCVCVCVCV